jgi:hypothetical protein
MNHREIAGAFSGLSCLLKQTHNQSIKKHYDNFRDPPINCLGIWLLFSARFQAGSHLQSSTISFKMRGRLHLRFGCAVLMCCKWSAAMTCLFDVQQHMWARTPRPT